jgi:hypothetical protein
MEPQDSSPCSQKHYKRPHTEPDEFKQILKGSDDGV